MGRQRIAILGSTGSIGEQTLDVIRHNRELFEATVLTANGSWRKLAQQALEFEPDAVVIASKNHYADLKEALSGTLVKVYAGEDAILQVVRGDGVDTVVNALVGYAGLGPTVSALDAGKKVALANKESLVVAGDIVMRKAMERRLPIVPIDSEHSAIFQCLAGEVSPYDKIILTASGGPFRNTPMEELASVSVESALNHPNWKMGNKITIDSATMLNKGFEVIEAHHLFGAPLSKIEVLIHPQSIVHSMVEFADGAIKAQLGTPDMRLPIQYALTYPHRFPLPEVSRRFNFMECGELTFLPVDMRRYPCLELAFEALRRGGNTACVLNGANEVAVASFLNGRIAFTDIAKVLEKCLAEATFVSSPSLDDLAQSNSESRELALKHIG